MSTPAIDAVIVVVPVHNEAALLDRCLRALAAAAAAVEVPCEVRVVLDACSDESALIAEGHPFPVLHCDARAVGHARARGVSDALGHLTGISPDRVWIANTDADSAVPPNWLRVQLDEARGGADVVLGTVRPDFEDLSPMHRELWLETHIRGLPNGNTHGANLGLRASTYEAAGGFAAVGEHEDVQLVDACRRIGASIVATDEAEVMTSGRFAGRTPGGYAGFLRDQARRLQLAAVLLMDQEAS